MNRRTFLPMSAMGLMAPNITMAAKSSNKPSMKKNLVLVTLDLGLYAKFHQEGGVNCKYMNDFFYDFKGEST